MRHPTPADVQRAILERIFQDDAENPDRPLSVRVCRLVREGVKLANDRHAKEQRPAPE